MPSGFEDTSDDLQFKSRLALTITILRVHSDAHRSAWRVRERVEIRLADLGPVL